MKKAVMISIQPKWCILIERGIKTVEIRKTKPKLETPFKCYIYCTKGNIDSSFYCGLDGVKNGKVIGEFMCYDIGEYVTEFYPPEKQPVYEAITEWNEENEVYEAVASNCDTYQTNFLKSTCMVLEDFREYLGVGEISFYGWHISDLVIYDEPKELSEFIRLCPEWEKEEITEKCIACTHFYRTYEECKAACDCEGEIHLAKAPQSWCYVEELI